MANFNLRTDLLALAGAQVFNLTMKEGANPQTCICIPIGPNGITVQPSRGDQNRMTAYVRMTMREISRQYIDKIVLEKQRNGDVVDMTKIESHFLNLSQPQEIFDLYKQAVANVVLQEHPDWQGQSLDPESKSQLYYTVRDRINKRVGKAYPLMASQSNAQTPVAPMQFAAPSTASPVAAGESVNPVTGEVISDDLPF